MRWWWRLLVTLILAPLLWRLGVAYIASQQGSTWDDLARQSVAILITVYLTFTLPALILCGLVLSLSDAILHRLGLDLMSVLVSPLLGWLVAAAVLAYVREPHVQAAQGAIPLAIFYGLVWGLTVRERRPARQRAADVVDASGLETQA